MIKLVPLHEIFNIEYGVNLELVNLEKCRYKDTRCINFVSRTEKNNGVSAFVKKLKDAEPNSANSISVAAGGSVLSAFFQKEEYYSGRDVYILTPKRMLSDLEMLFYAFCISKNKYKYNYGRQANKTLKDILVPESMSQEFYDIDINKLKTLNKDSVIEFSHELNTENWQEFNINNLFKIKGSKTTSILKFREYGKGKYPYVTTRATNNGVAGFFNYYTEEGNVLTIDSAVIGHTSYQPLPFSASDHVEKLIPKFKMNKYIALFLVTILNLEQYRYNYGRKSSQTRIRKVKIKLPTKNGNPDFEFMENYIKGLPYSSSI